MTGIFDKVKKKKEREENKEKRSTYKAPIDSDQRAKGFKEIEKSIDVLVKLKCLNPNYKPTYHPLGIIAAGGNANTSLAPSTVVRYEEVMTKMLDFLILIQDYSSAMILYHTKCPPKPTSISVHSAILFLRYMVHKKDERVKDPFTEEDYLLPDKRPLYAVQQWQGLSTVGIYRTTLGFIHRLYSGSGEADTDGTYFAECQECRKVTCLEKIKQGHGCLAHGGNPRYFRTGCPATAGQFKTALFAANRYIAENYDVHSTIALLPSELREIRASLFQTQEKPVEKLMLWCMIIIGVRLYLRIDEVLSLQMHSFLPQYFLVNRRKKHITSIVVKIRGKTDREDRYFHLWDDYNSPDLSAPLPLPLRSVSAERPGGRDVPLN